MTDTVDENEDERGDQLRRSDRSTGFQFDTVTDEETESQSSAGSDTERTNGSASSTETEADRWSWARPVSKSESADGHEDDRIVDVDTPTESENSDTDPDPLPSADPADPPTEADTGFDHGTPPVDRSVSNGPESEGRSDAAVDRQPPSSSDRRSTGQYDASEVDERDRLWDEFDPAAPTDANDGHCPSTDDSSDAAPNSGEDTSEDQFEITTSFDNLLEEVSQRTETRENEREPAGAATDRTNAETTSPTDTIDEILESAGVFGRGPSSSQILVLSPTHHKLTDYVFSQFVTPVDTDPQNVLFVTANGTGGRQLQAAQQVRDWPNGKAAIVEVGKPQFATPEATDTVDIYKRISSPENLAKLGVVITHIVSQWKDDRLPTVMGFHTLSLSQQYVGNDTLFQFLYTLRSQLNSSMITGCYHMDPSNHDAQEVEVIRSAFDIVIEISPDGRVTID